MRRLYEAVALAAMVCFGRFAIAAPVQLLILGDSLTAGYGLPIPDGFQAQLSAALGPNVALVDGAVSGDTSADGAARLDWVLAGWTRMRCSGTWRIFWMCWRRIIFRCC
jgi:acyl-CoA thioesterase-1